MPEQIPEEPKKKEGKYRLEMICLEVKQLSKKERKAQEDAELDAIFGGLPTEDAAKAKPNEEKKE